MEDGYYTVLHFDCVNVENCGIMMYTINNNLQGGSYGGLLKRFGI